MASIFKCFLFIDILRGVKFSPIDPFFILKRKQKNRRRKMEKRISHTTTITKATTTKKGMINQMTNCLHLFFCLFSLISTIMKINDFTAHLLLKEDENSNFCALMLLIFINYIFFTLSCHCYCLC